MAFGSLILSMLLAPGAVPSAWDWFRLLAGFLLGGSALLLLSASQHLDPATGSQHLVMGAGAGLIAGFAVSLTFGVGTVLLYSLAFTTAGYLVLANRRLSGPRLVGGVIAALIPLWVWSALDAWISGLLVLLPLVTIAVMADGHMRLATQAIEPTSGLSRRGHRLAAWLGVLGSALLVALLALATSHALPIAALAGLGAVLLVGLEAASPTPAEGSWRVSSVTLIDTASAWIAFCWLAGLS